MEISTRSEIFLCFAHISCARKRIDKEKFRSAHEIPPSGKQPLYCFASVVADICAAMEAPSVVVAMFTFLLIVVQTNCRFTGEINDKL